MTRLWKDDEELFRLVREELYTAVVGDMLDGVGRFHQFLPPGIGPLQEKMVLVGRAMPVIEADIDPESRGAAGARPFGLMLEALDDLKRNEVYVCSGASSHYALWGELMSTRARKLGAAGAVVDGYARDTRQILRMGFPVFCVGSYAQDQAPRGEVRAFRVPLQIGDVSIRPGDIVFGDVDGVCVVPREHEEEVLTLALQKARGEKVVRKAIEGGMSACQAFRTYGIL